jgi:hypothetical protein
MRNNIHGTPPKYGNYRMTKTRSAAGNCLPGMMRTGRTTENDGLNVIAANGRGQQKNDVSEQSQQRTPGVKTQSSSQLNGAYQQQQKIRAAVVSTAAKHCHECGEAFPVDWAKFCCGCGEKRIGLE